MGQSGMLRLTKCLPLMGSKIIKIMKKKKKKLLYSYLAYTPLTITPEVIKEIQSKEINNSALAILRVT